jgi:hypothetical protein
MFINQLLESSHKRVPWQIMQVLLKTCELPSGNGWKGTIEKLTSLINGEHLDSSLVAGFNKLKELYIDYLLTGEKAVKLFSIESSVINTLVSFFHSYTFKENLFSKAYPFDLDESNLSKVDYLPKIVEIRNSESKLVVVFCTKRVYTERNEIDLNQFSQDVKKELDYYDEIIGIKKYERQFFDVIVVRKDKGLLEIRIDMANGISSKERQTAFFEIEKSFQDLLKDNLGTSDIFENKINFFPLIDRLYHSEEGKVGEIAFTTDEGSEKRERMRRGSIDLRNETYHKAGREAVEHINLFKLAILWSFPISHRIQPHPELYLPGTSRSLSNVVQELDEALVKKCTGSNDYEFVFEKIITYLEGYD